MPIPFGSAAREFYEIFKNWNCVVSLFLVRYLYQFCDVRLPGCLYDKTIRFCLSAVRVFWLLDGRQPLWMICLPFSRQFDYYDSRLSNGGSMRGNW